MAFTRTARPARANRSVRSFGAAPARKASLHSDTLRTVAFAPDEADSRYTSAGKPYVRTRGTLTWRKQDLVRTLMIFGDLAEQMAAPMLDGASVVLEGRFKRVRNEDGTLGGEFFVAERLVNILDAEGRPVSGDGTGRVIEGHYREGYYRRQHYGPGNSMVKRIWVEGTDVNGGPRKAA